MDKIIGYERAYGTEFKIATTPSQRVPLARVYMDGTIFWAIPVGTRSQYKQVYRCSKKYKEALAEKERLVETYREKREQSEFESYEYFKLTHNILNLTKEILHIKSMKQYPFSAETIANHPFNIKTK